MAQTLQKKIKFSKGQIVPELIERTDLELYNSSAQELTNFVSTIYGGLESRRGTKYISTHYGTYKKDASGDVLESIGNADTLQTWQGWTSDEINDKRVLFSLDYRTNITGEFVIDRIKTNGGIEYAKVGNKIDYQIPSGVYRVLLCGAGEQSISFKGLESWDFRAGGSGGGFSGTLKFIEKGHLVIEYLNNITTMKFNDQNLMTVGDGIAFGHLNISIPSTVGSIVSYGVKSDGIPAKELDEIRDNLIVGHEYGGGSIFPDGKGASGRGKYLGEGLDAAYPGKPAEFGFKSDNLIIPALVQVSDNNVSWTTIKRFNISKQEFSGSFNIEDKRYVRVVLDLPTEYSVKDKISVSTARLRGISTNLFGKIRLEDFEFNDDQKYLLVLSESKISIYQNDVFATEIEAEGLTDQIIQTVSLSQKDDIIVFAHEKMRTKQLKRTPTGWVWEDFPFKNIPYHAFNGEQETTLTVPIKPSKLEGSLKITADSPIFDSSFVGQYIDGNGGRVRITEFISNLVVNGVTQIPFYTDDKINSWKKITGYQKVWSAEKGYPSTCLFAQQRLWFGGSDTLPANIWASRVGQYNDFKNAGNYSNDAIDVSLLTNNRIYHIIDNRGLHILTAGEEISAPEGSYTPDKIAFTTNTRNGSLRKIVPVIIDGVILFVEKNGTSLLGYVYNYEQASYVSDDLSMFSNLIHKPVSMDVLKNTERSKGDFLYMVLDDGTMLVSCISFSQKIFSSSLVKTDGKIVSVKCVGEEVYLVVERNDKQNIEKFDNLPTDCTLNRYVDTNTVDNLDILNGSSVYVYSDSKNYGKFNVENGKINLPIIPNEDCRIGLSYEYNLVSNPIMINNKTITCKKRIAKATVYCKDTKILSFNGQKKMSNDIFDFYACTQYANDVRFKVTGEFYPIHLLSVFLNINYEG